jgi:hypothetical protein
LHQGKISFVALDRSDVVNRSVWSAARDFQAFVAGGDGQSAADLSVVLVFRPDKKFISAGGIILGAVGTRTILGPQYWGPKKAEKNDKV